MCFFILFLVSCSNEGLNTDAKEAGVELLEEYDSTRINLVLNTNKAFLAKGLVDIQTINSSIVVDLKYASSDNFMHTILYDTLQRVYLQKEVAERLSNCQNFLDSIHPGYKLKVFDGVRPQNVQWEMWRALDSIPVSRRGKFVSNPSKGSVHNYGAAVDLTIIDNKGREIDMGAGYDDFREIAFPKYEQYFFDLGELNKLQIENRKLLRRVMIQEGFRNIPSEWWHFNAFSRYETSHKFQILRNESGKMEWYKLIIKKDSLRSTPVNGVPNP